jgi:hypothetical protein
MERVSVVYSLRPENFATFPILELEELLKPAESTCVMPIIPT